MHNIPTRENVTEMKSHPNPNQTQDQTPQFPHSPGGEGWVGGHNNDKLNKYQCNTYRTKRERGDREGATTTNNKGRETRGAQKGKKSTYRKQWVFCNSRAEAVIKNGDELLSAVA